MSSNRPAAVVCLAFSLCLAAGCSKEYSHKRFEKCAAEFVAVQTMLDELRAAGKDELDGVMSRQILDGLKEYQKKGLRYLLGELAKAETVTLKGVDRWRSDLYRATIQWTTEDATGTRALLLIQDSDEKLYWAKAN